MARRKWESAQSATPDQANGTKKTEIAEAWTSQNTAVVSAETT